MSGILLIVLVFFLLAGGLGAVAFFTYQKKLRRAKAIERGLKMVPILIHLPPPSHDTHSENRDIREVMREKTSQAEVLYNLIAGTATEGFKSNFYGQRHIALELIVSEGIVHFFAAVPVALVSVVKKAVLTAYPGARLEEVEDHNIFNQEGRLAATLGGEMTLKNENAYPIATYDQLDKDPMEALLTTISALQKEDGVALQIMLRPAAIGWIKKSAALAEKLRKGKNNDLKFTAMDLAKAAVKAPAERRAEERQLNGGQPDVSKLQLSNVERIEEKVKHPGFEVLIRVIVSTGSVMRSQQLLRDIATAFALYDAPGLNGFRFLPAVDVQGLVTAFIFRFFPNELSSNVLNSAELATLFHFPDSQFTPSASVERQQSKQVDGPVQLPTAGLLFGFNEFRGVKKEIRLSAEDRRRHTYILGQTGTGKSTMLENLAVQDMLAGNGFAFIDPHGDSAEKLLALVPKERAEDVIYFNPADTQYPLGLNLFEFTDPAQKDFIVQETINMLYKLYDPGHTGIIGPRYEHWYRNAALTLMSDPGGSTFIEIPKVFTDTDYLKKKFKYLKDPTVIDFWTKEMGQTSDFHKSEMLGWFVSKFGAFQNNEMMRNIIGQTKSSFNLRDVMDHKKILVVNLSKGRIGELNSQLLGMIFVIKFQAAAMSRADMPEAERADFALYVDEFQNFSTDSFASILSEARKYRLNLIVANQFIGQLSPEVRDAVFGNIGTIVAHRMGPDDAEFMVKQFAPVFDASDLVNIPNYHAAMRLMIGGLPSQPFSIADSAPLGNANAELGLAIKQLSAAKFGHDKAVVEADLIDRLSAKPPISKERAAAASPAVTSPPPAPGPVPSAGPAPAPVPAPVVAPAPEPEPAPAPAPAPPPVPEPAPAPLPTPQLVPALAQLAFASAPAAAPAPGAALAERPVAQPVPVQNSQPAMDAVQAPIGVLVAGAPPIGAPPIGAPPIDLPVGDQAPGQATFAQPQPAQVVPALTQPAASPASGLQQGGAEDELAQQLVAAQSQVGENAPQPQTALASAAAATLATAPPPIGAPPIGAPPVALPNDPGTLSIGDITGGGRSGPVNAAVPAEPSPLDDVPLLGEGPQPEYVADGQPLEGDPYANIDILGDSPPPSASQAAPSQPASAGPVVGDGQPLADDPYAGIDVLGSAPAAPEPVPVTPPEPAVQPPAAESAVQPPAAEPASAQLDVPEPAGEPQVLEEPPIETRSGSEPGPAPEVVLEPVRIPADLPVPEPVAASEPVPTAPAVTPAPEPIAEPAGPEPIAAPVPAPLPVPAPRPVPAPEPMPRLAPEPASAPRPAPAPRLRPAPAPVLAAEPEPAPPAKPEPAPQFQPEPVPEPAPAPQQPAVSGPLIHFVDPAAEKLLNSPDASEDLTPDGKPRLSGLPEGVQLVQSAAPQPAPLPPVSQPMPKPAPQTTPPAQSQPVPQVDGMPAGQADLVAKLTAGPEAKPAVPPPPSPLDAVVSVAEALPPDMRPHETPVDTQGAPVKPAEAPVAAPEPVAAAAQAEPKAAPEAKPAPAATPPIAPAVPVAPAAPATPAMEPTAASPPPASGPGSGELIKPSAPTQQSQPATDVTPAEQIKKAEHVIDDLLSVSLIKPDSTAIHRRLPEPVQSNPDEERQLTGNIDLGVASPPAPPPDDRDKYAPSEHHGLKVIEPLEPIVPSKERFAKEIAELNKAEGVQPTTPAPAPANQPKPAGPASGQPSRPTTPAPVPGAGVKPAVAVPGAAAPSQPGAVPPMPSSAAVSLPPAPPAAAVIKHAEPMMLSQEPAPVAQLQVDEFGMPEAQSLAAGDVAKAKAIQAPPPASPSVPTAAAPPGPQPAAPGKPAGQPAPPAPAQAGKPDGQKPAVPAGGAPGDAGSGNRAGRRRRHRLEKPAETVGSKEEAEHNEPSAAAKEAAPLTGKLILPTGEKPAVEVKKADAPKPKKLAPGEVYVDDKGNVLIGE